MKFGLATTGLALSLINAGCAKPPVALDKVKPSDPDYWISDVRFDGDETKPPHHDPLIELNRKTYFFNHELAYRLIGDPVSEKYQSIVPEDIADCFTNFFENLGELPKAFKHLAIGEWNNFLKGIERFGINSTFGIYGLADAAEREFGLKEEDFGFADVFYFYNGLLGWGDPINTGIPLWGDMNSIEFFGKLLDIPFSPLTYLGPVPQAAGLTIGFIDGMNNTRESREHCYSAIDPYMCISSGVYEYSQKRHNIKNKLLLSSD